VEGLDVARGVVALVMVFGHAFDAWVSPAGKETTAYAVKRFLGTFPLPTFLLLAGIAVAWRVDAAVRRGESAGPLRRRLVRRGLQIVAMGYAANLFYAALDGGRGLDALLRADVLHVIGLSIAGFAAIGVRGDPGEVPGDGDGAPPDLERLVRRGALLGAGVALVSPLANVLGAEASGVARYPLALLVEVPGGAGRMPVFPLAAWLAAGLLVGRLMLRARRGLPPGAPLPRSGTTPRMLGLLAATGLLLAALGQLATNALLGVFPGDFDRRHPAIWANLVDLGGRALVLIALACWASTYLRGRLRWLLLTMGQHSLTAYVVHMPFAYGRFGRPVQGRLDPGEAMVGVLLLWTVTVGAVVLWARIRRAATTARTAQVPTPAAAVPPGGLGPDLTTAPRSGRSAISPHLRRR
jgi:hypothetical protein